MQKYFDKNVESVHFNRREDKFIGTNAGSLIDLVVGGQNSSLTIASIFSGQ